MLPELLNIPFLNFTVNTYGVLIALAFLTGLFVMARLAARDGLDKNHVYDLGLWVLVAALIGSKLLMVITEWDSRSLDNPGRFFRPELLSTSGRVYGGLLRG